MTHSTPNKHLKLRLKSISFRPDVRLKQAMTGVSAIRSKYTHHSLKLSEVEIDMKLKEYFADHDVLIRSDFQALCGMARTTANVHLKRLQQEGKLKNVGKAHATHLPGHAGVLRCVARCKGGAVRTESGFTGKADEQEDGRKR